MSVFCLQATREVQQQLFGLSTQVTQLRRDVDRLGTAQDTVKLRQKIAEANQNTTSSAKSIGQSLNALHAEHKTQQTGRLVSSFEVQKQSQLVQACHHLISTSDFMQNPTVFQTAHPPPFCGCSQAYACCAGRQPLVAGTNHNCVAQDGRALWGDIVKNRHHKPMWWAACLL